MRIMRRGVVLFITLSIIAAMLAMVGAIFAYLDKSRENASYASALIEADLLYFDSITAIDTLLKKAPKDKEAKKTVLSTLYLAPMTLQAEDDEAMFTTLTCQSLDRGININWLGLENNSSAQQYYTLSQVVFDKLVEDYNIQNAAQLLSRIKNAIGGNEGRDTGIQAGLTRKKGIIKLSQLEEIAREYRFAEDDASVEKIEWGDYFSFDTGEEMIDGSYLPAGLLSILFEIEPDVVKEEWSEGSDLRGFVSSQGGDMTFFDNKIFAKEPIERMQCQINYGYRGNVYAFGFEYLEGKAEKFEFYGKQ